MYGKSFKSIIVHFAEIVFFTKEKDINILFHTNANVYVLDTFFHLQVTCYVLLKNVCKVQYCEPKSTSIHIPPSFKSLPESPLFISYQKLHWRQTKIGEWFDLSHLFRLQHQSADCSLWPVIPFYYSTMKQRKSLGRLFC